MTVAIVAILAAIAIPSYTQYLRKGRRADGTSCLLQVRDRMERFYQRSNAYPTRLGELLGGSKLAAADADAAVAVCPGESSRYRLALVTSEADCALPTCYVLTATPGAGTPQVSDGTLKLVSRFSDDPNERLRKFRIVGGATKDNWDDY